MSEVPSTRRNVLFVCSRNQWRSPTAEQLFRRHPGLSVRSAGTSAGARRRVTDDGSLLLIAREHRSQEQNRRAAEDRLATLICAALVEPKLRRATRPTRASKERRLEGKSRRSSVKAGRGKIGRGD